MFLEICIKTWINSIKIFLHEFMSKKHKFAHIVFWDLAHVPGILKINKEISASVEIKTKVK